MATVIVTGVVDALAAQSHATPVLALRDALVQREVLTAPLAHEKLVEGQIRGDRVLYLTGDTVLDALVRNRGRATGVTTVRPGVRVRLTIQIDVVRDADVLDDDTISTVDRVEVRVCWIDVI